MNEVSDDGEKRNNWASKCQKRFNICSMYFDSGIIVGVVYADILTT